MLEEAAVCGLMCLVMEDEYHTHKYMHMHANTNNLKVDCINTIYKYNKYAKRLHI